jgi:hypothetical protein
MFVIWEKRDNSFETCCTQIGYQIQRIRLLQHLRLAVAKYVPFPEIP